jgi:hypothetical protein
MTLPPFVWLMVRLIPLRKSGEQHTTGKGFTLLKRNTQDESIHPLSYETDCELFNSAQWGSSWMDRAIVSLELKYGIFVTVEPIIIAFLSGDRKNR